MKYILNYLKPYYSVMLAGLLIKILGTLADLSLPRILAYILDYVVPDGQINKVFIWGAVMIAFAVLARLFNICANRMAAKVAAQTTRTIRHDLYGKINRLSGAQMDHFTVPSLISRMTTDTYNVHQLIGMMQRIGVRAPIILFGGILITATMEPVLTLILVIVIPFLALVVFGISRKSIPLVQKVQTRIDCMVNVLRENITGIRVIKALSRTEHEKKHFREVNDDLVKSELKAAGTMAASSPLMNLFLNLALTAVVVVGAYRVNSGASETGNIVAFLSYFTMILNSILMVNRIFLTITKTTASAQRLTEVLTAADDLPVMTTEKQTGTEPEENQTERRKQTADSSFLCFDSVSFRYHKEGNHCLQNISFSLNRGETLGIIGSTGCGKTTLINLLMRFYDVETGSIRLDGRDIRTIPLQELRRKFGAAFQNDTIFADTVYENISFCRSIEPDRVREAARDACAYDFIEELGDENGENSKYNYRAAIRGANLSGGQKQRLLIARALAAKPEILILDDASSALDYKTDALLRKLLREHYSEATVILVAQRISSVMTLDHVMVMEEGQIIGYGSHEELLSSCEVYREIYNSQMAS